MERGFGAENAKQNSADRSGSGLQALVPDYFVRTRTPANSIDPGLVSIS